jgi:RNA polymerase sigma factor (sigma-70 family)
VEAHALTQDQLSGRRAPASLLRIAGDERLVALTRRGDEVAFEVIVSRYRSRLLGFCARIVGSREDAEDVLQEVFAAAYNALRANEREINLRPWLYRIARNRSLNHLRRHTAIGVDSMDVHYAEMGISTGDKVFRREEFRLLVGDIHRLPESQRTALLLREIEGLSYEQIAEVMDTTVSGIKSLLVRARIGLAEASESRKLTCDEVRFALAEEAEGVGSLTQPMRRHLKGCERCAGFRTQLRSNRRALAALAPFAPFLLLKHLFATKLGASGAGVGGGAAAAGGSTAAAGGGVGALATTAVAAKALTTVAAAALLTVGTTSAIGGAHAAKAHAAPSVAASSSEQVTTTTVFPSATPIHHAHHHHLLASVAPVTAAPGASTGVSGSTSAGASEQVTTTTVFPSAATGTTSTTLASTQPAPATAPTSGAGGSATGAAPTGDGTGTASATGASGTTGATGSTGASGATGTTGTSGPTGSSGATGTSGTTAATGETGSSGGSGATGATAGS